MILPASDIEAASVFYEQVLTTRGDIGRQQWGERSFYAHDRWGNPFWIVEHGTEFRGRSFLGR